MPRRDRENSPLGEGFTLVVYLNPNPAVRGTGYEVGISVTDESGLDLTELWIALEAAETTAWERSGSERHADKPREDFLLPPGQSTYRWNQPWFPLVAGAQEGLPRTTLIAAPRRASPDSEFGTRLTFDAILDVIWRTASPAKFALVAPWVGAARPRAHPCELLELAEDDQWQAGLGPGPRKRLFLAEYAGGRRPGAANISRLFASETLRAALFARLATGDRVSFKQVTQTEAHDEIEIDGGFAFVSEYGAWVFDDWTEASIDAPRIRSTFWMAQHALSTIDQRDTIISTLSDSVNELIQRPPFLGQGVSRQLTRRASKLEAELAWLDEQWELSRRLAAQSARLKAISESLTTVETLRARTGIALLAILGVPFSLSMTLSERLGKGVTEARAANVAQARLAICKAGKIEKDRAEAAKVAGPSLPYYCSDPKHDELEQAALKTGTLLSQSLARVPEPWSDVTLVIGGFGLTLIALWLLRSGLRIRSRGALSA
jgi:hypothetical protein